MFFWDKFKIENVEDRYHQWQLEKHEPASSDAADTFQLVLKNIWFPTFQLCLQEIMSAVSSERNLQFQTWTRLQCLQCLQCVEWEQAGCLSVGRCRRQKLMFFLLNREVSVSSCLSEPWCLPLRIKNSFSKRISYFSVLLFGLCPVNCSWEGNAAESWKINHPGSVCFACGPFVCIGSCCTSAPLCFLFSCDAPPERPPQSSAADILPDFDQRRSSWCPEDAGPNTFSSSLVSPWNSAEVSSLFTSLWVVTRKTWRSRLHLLLPPPSAALSAVAAAAPWEIFLALDHFSSWQLHTSLIIPAFYI